MKKQWLFALIAFGIIALLGIVFPFSFNTGDTSGIDTGDTAWMLASTALVFLMTPGLGFFYGGMVKPKNVISTILQSFRLASTQRSYDCGTICETRNSSLSLTMAKWLKTRSSTMKTRASVA